jgi:uncharacterized protein
MLLEGVVTNVTAFGAFVDIGVHQDGLVHISELADRFVKDPREIVKAGDVVKVRVKEVDIERRRIALSMKSGSAAARPGPGGRERSDKPHRTRSAQPDTQQGGPRTTDDGGESALAAALRRAGRNENEAS